CLTTLQTCRDRLTFDAATGRLVSLFPLDKPGCELIEANGDDPAFIIQYLDNDRAFREISSSQAGAVTCRGETGALTFSYAGLAGLNLSVTFTVRAAPDDRYSYWSFSLANNAGLRVTNVQFPFIVMPYRLGESGGEALVWPLGPGQLLRAPRPQDLAPDCAHTWQLVPENGTPWHYPGYTGAQFLAYYGAQAGLFLAARDAEGYIKLIKPVHHSRGLRLGMAHVGDWPSSGARALPYELVLGSFEGDWYDAADLYRAWSLQQPWARPLSARQDIPGWLLDSPPHVIVRIQGELDAGPAEPNEAFLPYRKIIPLLEPLAKAWDAPLVPVIMSWERPGPWIYPDCFPPAGGDESLTEFSKLVRERGWHVGTFCNGTRWVTGHYWSNYDGTAYFAEHEGLASVCCTHEGVPWKEYWDTSWRPSYACCAGAALTRATAVNYYQHMLDDGLDWIQFFDQNVGAASFACYAEDHNHPPEPGRWMTTAMQGLIGELHALEARATAESGEERKIALSVEAPCNEYNLQDFAICDVRVVPEGHVHWSSRWIPLYHYLYHECILIQGGFGMGPEPYHMPIRTAYNLVVGEIPGAVLTGDGRLLNYDTENWAPWEPYIGSNADALQSLHAATALRRGPARDWLVYGRMQRPAQVEGIEIVEWEREGKVHRIPAVFQGAWRAPDGRFALLLANWTNDARTVTLRDPRLMGDLSLVTSAEQLSTTRLNAMDSAYRVTVPSLGAVLLVQA
ncbi:MAG: DUF6259 domain-containing protein, partial [Chloroflexi bacterium]|nr:DUF6259 domain-containing protein [Chloroflexota bacterium]